MIVVSSLASMYVVFKLNIVHVDRELFGETLQIGDTVGFIMLLFYMYDVFIIYCSTKNKH